MSRTLSPSSHQPYGVARETAIWNLARSREETRRTRWVSLRRLDARR
jgi:hypothetical protein